ncbi:MAG: hypothetical protein LUH02_10630, partial [Erysipelotrichaceae bacterium]|nr:hypothetical protein [Erysipelotrichaceae bacterium]
KINNGDIDIVIHLECSKTSYREIKNLNNKLNDNFMIKKKHLNGRLELCCMLIASKDLIIDSSMDISNDYHNTSFPIEKGYILGYYNAGNIMIDKANDELVKPSSIFSVVKKMDANIPMSVDLNDSRRIKIILDKKTHEQFVPLNNNKFLPILHSIIVLPTLIFVLDELKNDSNMFSEHGEKLWFHAIEKQLKKLNIDLYNRDLNNCNSLVVAQELLKSPIDKSLDLLTKIGDE